MIVLPEYIAVSRALEFLGILSLMRALSFLLLRGAMVMGMGRYSDENKL